MSHLSEQTIKDFARRLSEATETPIPGSIALTPVFDEETAERIVRLLVQLIEEKTK